MNKWSLPTKHSKISAQLAVVLLLATAVAISAAALLFSSSGQEVTAFDVPRAARVERVDGPVEIARPLDESVSEFEWSEGTINTPLSVGNQIHTGEGASTLIGFTGRNYAKLEPRSSIDVLSLADRRTQLALRSGSALFDIGHLESGELFEVATPYGALDFHEPGLYQVGIGEGNAMISVLSGLAQIAGLAGTGQIGRGEILTLAGQTAAQVLLSRLAPDLAGAVVDDYYGYRYPDQYDGRYQSYDAYEDDPYYYSRHHRSVAYRHVPYYDVPGLYDLDHYGDWVDVGNYGTCWRPRVDSGWSPYSDGRWELDNVWGPTWISREQWGWAPYHYGRWAHVDSHWFWVPERSHAAPVYSPALVAFVPVHNTNQIAWVPLAPGERYVPRYYGRGFKPHYVTSSRALRFFRNAERPVHLSIPDAITLVPVSEFTRAVRRDRRNRVNPALLANLHSVRDPFEFDSLRNAMLARDKNRKARSRRDNGAFNRSVVVSVPPAVPAGRRDVIEAVRIRALDSRHKRRALRYQDQRDRRKFPAVAPQPPIPQPNASPVARQKGQRVAAAAIETARRRSLSRQQTRDERRLERRRNRQSLQTVPPVPVIVPKNHGGGATVTTEQIRQQRKAQRQLQRRQRIKDQSVQPPVAQNRNPRSRVSRPAAAVKPQTAGRVGGVQQNIRLRQAQRQNAATRQVQRQNAATRQVQRQERKAAAERQNRNQAVRSAPAPVNRDQQKSEVKAARKAANSKAIANGKAGKPRPR